MKIFLPQISVGDRLTPIMLPETSSTRHKTLSCVCRKETIGSGGGVFIGDETLKSVEFIITSHVLL